VQWQFWQPGSTQKHYFPHCLKGTALQPDKVDTAGQRNTCIGLPLDAMRTGGQLPGKYNSNSLAKGIVNGQFYFSPLSEAYGEGCGRIKRIGIIAAEGKSR
jgi:hypothetical protein